MLHHMTKTMSTPSTTKLDNNAIYHELNPKLKWLVRIVNLITLAMVVIAVVLCVVQGAKVNASYYLLVCNLVISGLVGIVVNWWYRNGDLTSDISFIAFLYSPAAVESSSTHYAIHQRVGSEKFWFIILVGVVIFIQCLTMDLFVFKEEVKHIPTTTPRHNSTRPFTWATMVSPTVKPS